MGGFEPPTSAQMRRFSTNLAARHTVVLYVAILSQHFVAVAGFERRNGTSFRHPSCFPVTPYGELIPLCVSGLGHALPTGNGRIRTLSVWKDLPPFFCSPGVLPSPSLCELVFFASALAEPVVSFRRRPSLSLPHGFCGCHGLPMYVYSAAHGFRPQI